MQRLVQPQRARSVDLLASEALMSYLRHARRKDTTTDAIVVELRARGYVVQHIGRPVDLLITHPSWPINTWKLLECKTPSGKEQKLKLRKDQEEQQKFCAEHGVPYAISPLEALHAMGEQIRL
jgi:hypothetical protein